MIKIDQEKCIGCGTCAVIAGKTFLLNDFGKAEICGENGDDEETIKSAVDACPTQAISCG